MLTLIKIHRQLSHAMQIVEWYFICAHELFSIWSFRCKLAFGLLKFSLCQDKNLQERFLPIFFSEEAEEAKIWWNQQNQRRTGSLAPDLSDCGSHCLKTKKNADWLKELEDTRPANEAEGQNKTKVLVARNCWRMNAIPIVKHRCTCRRCWPRDFLF